MTTLSGIVTVTATGLFIYANYGLWQAAVAYVSGAGLIYLLHKQLRRDPQEDTD